MSADTFAVRPTVLCIFPAHAFIGMLEEAAPA